MIRFSPANIKLRKLEKKTKKKVYSFDILSGVSCPFAKECHAWVIKRNGTRKVKDGPHCRYRCYSASQEALYPKTYDFRKENSKILKLSFSEMVRTLSENIPEDAKIIRIHTSGDFNSQRYFDAWLKVARLHPHLRFYGYTKALPYWIKRKNNLPKNLKLTASRGGTHDHLIAKHRLRNVTVVLWRGQRDSVSHRILPIDKNDYMAYTGGKNFSLLIHGTQPEGSIEGKAVYKLRYNK